MITQLKIAKASAGLARNIFSKLDLEGLFNAYRNTLSEDEFVEYMKRVAHWCEVGTDDIPKTPDKVDYWYRVADEASLSVQV